MCVFQMAGLSIIVFDLSLLLIAIYLVFFIPFTDWPYNAHSFPFEQLKSAHYVPSLYRVLAEFSVFHSAF